MSTSIATQRLVETLQQAATDLAAGAPEVVLDFSAVRRMDPCGVAALCQLASLEGPRVVLDAVNLEVYKVLKLAGLTHRFSFRS